MTDKKSPCLICNGILKEEDMNETHIPYWCSLTHPDWRASPEEWETPLTKLILKHEEENNIEIHCAGLGCQHRKIIPMNTMWFGEASIGNGIYCFDCYRQKLWFDSVCVGCVTGFPDCGFGRIFMFTTGKRELTNKEKRIILSGRCPFRIGGTFISRYNLKIERIDISEKADYQNGIAILKGIKKYKKLYWKG